jgi:hypothetical protein
MTSNIGDKYKKTDWKELDIDPLPEPGHEDDSPVWFIDPQDRMGAFQYWWEDMRPREVRKLVIEAYEQGKMAGNRMYKQTLKEFIDSKRPGYTANAYVTFPGFAALYVRHAFRIINGKYYWTLDLANAEADKPGSGAATRLIDWIFENYPETVIFVENVFNDRFEGKLERMGFTRITDKRPYCYQKGAVE